ncbi:MAG: hypothetical protein HKN90_07970 [Flavobacteriaceae bacterium]|nr:hypothetical protein [Flavobacteriaceae bacterium]
MKLSKEIGITFYQNLGTLLYAIAASDRHVHKKEYEAFNEILKNELHENVANDYAAYAFYQAKTSFDYYSSINADANECFNTFMKFKRSNEEMFNNKIKKLVMGAATSIAAAFSSKNKSELIMLAKLELELNKKFQS